MILLDTQSLLWLAMGNERLGKAARERLQENEDRRAPAMVWWEIAMLASKQRVALNLPLDRWKEDVAKRLGIDDVAMDGAIALDAGSLPGDIHGDPCDRVMIATARALGCPLMTADRAILDYARQGHVRVVDARH